MFIFSVELAFFFFFKYLFSSDPLISQMLCHNNMETHVIICCHFLNPEYISEYLPCV